MHCQLKVKPPQGTNFKKMKAIQIQFNTNWFDVDFNRDLFLTDSDVRDILKKTPNKYQGYYTKISRVSELHTKKLLELADKYGKKHCFKVYDM